MTAIATVMFSGCGIYGKYSRPEVQTANLYGSDVRENADSATLATLSWREIFTDPQLQALIDTGLARNTDLHSLDLAVRQAEAGYRASKLAFVPGFTFVPQGGYNISDNAPGWGYAIPVAMDWELDLFGKQLNQKRKAGAALRMTQDVREAAQTQIVATIASLYYQLLMLDEQRAVTDSAARKWRETVRVMRQMKEAGMMDEVSVSQSEATCFAVESSVFDIQKAIRSVENALCLILKQTPHSIPRSNVDRQVLPAELKVGVSAQLLANRPDVRQAEHELEQYFYGVQHARSMFYPSIRIDASVTYAHAFIPSLIGQLVQPIFAHGGLKANLDIVKAQYEQALLAFEQKLLQAGSDVNEALVQCQTARTKHEKRAQQVDALQRAMNFSSSSYSAWSLSFSRPVSWRRRISTMAAAWISVNPKLLTSRALASSTLWDSRMVWMTSSMMSMALSRPSRMWARLRALSSSKRVRRTTTSWRKSTKHLMISLRERVRGRPPTRATLLIAKLDCRAVYLKSVLRTTLALASFLTRNSMRMPSRLVSSLISAMPSIFLSSTISPMRLIISLLLTM